MADGATPKIDAGENRGPSIVEARPQIYHDTPDSVTFKKVRKRLLRQSLDSIRRFSMEGTDASSAPKWLVCLSGG